MKSLIRGASIALVCQIALMATAVFAAADVKTAEAALARGEYQTALDNLRPLADKGRADALYLLGTLYANGDGVGQDDAKAIECFRAAAAKGNKSAAQALVALYRFGELPAPEAGWRVQLAIAPNDVAARREWRRLTKAYADILANLALVTVPQEEGEGVRVQGGPLDESVARAICSEFKGSVQTCRVVKPTTDSPPN